MAFNCADDIPNNEEAITRRLMMKKPSQVVEELVTAINQFVANNDRALINLSFDGLIN